MTTTRATPPRRSRHATPTATRTSARSAWTAFLTEDECKTYECGDIATSPSACFAKWKAYYDCTNKLSSADLCADMACDTQYKALMGCSGG